MWLSKIRKLNSFHIAGVFFFVSELFILSALLFDPSARVFLLWSCNNFAVLLIYACYKKDMQVLKGISYLGLVSQILWIADFNSHSIGYNISGITDYIFTEGFTYANKVSIGIHTLLPVAILLFTLKTKPEPRSLLYALPYIFILYIATLLFSPVSEDINCVFNACGNGTFFPGTPGLWPLYAIASTGISYLVHLLLYSAWLPFRRKNLF